jgi:signal transduction histidine kinase
MVLSISFSAAFYVCIDQSLNEPIALQRGIRHSVVWGENDEFYSVVKQRDADLRADLWAGLAFTNVGVLIFGAMASYFLARLTLKPVNDAMEAQSRFVSDASHELRTPLAALALENEVFLRDKSTVKNDLLAQVESNLEEVQKLQRLTTSLLNLSDTQSLTLDQISTQIVGENAAKAVQKSAAIKHIEIHIKATGNIIANDEALTQLLVILLDNAIKYSPEDTTITVNGQNGRMQVSDQGPGIAADDLPHLFDRFYRSEKSRTSDGHGLGLSLAQSLASHMKLKLTAQNNPGRGATFTIS